VPQKFRWLHLLIASYIFYGYWEVKYLGLIIFSTLIDYFAGYAMGKKATKSEKKPFLYLSLLLNIGLLFTFKYYNFFFDSFIAAFHISEEYALSHKLNVLLPVGISFYTFQTLSYTIDVYNDKIKPTSHLGKFAAYVSFFPQLVAGPIERASSLLPQFDKKVNPDFANIADGLKLMAWGFFKKIVIADRLMSYIGDVYSDTLSKGHFDQIFVFLTGLLMIYADFSAYTDIARGSAQTFGFKLIDNFKQPFFSKTMSSFWSKWHISMTTWFGDYLYKPLLSSKTGNKWMNYLGLLILFFIIGLWHGAKWTFVLWGETLCVMMIFGNMSKKIRNQFWSFLGRKVQSMNSFLKLVRAQFDYISVFFITALTTPLFFADNMTEAIRFYGSIINFDNHNPSELLSSRFDLIVLLFSFLLMWLVDTLEKKQQCSIVAIVNKRSAFLRYCIYIAIIYVILNFGEFGVKEFIYFQF
jgi:D-alanyl-lipoteichoic acid acyltransferase DltB (MBOAT superfamily)